MVTRQTAFENSEEPQERGQATEAILKSELLARGIPVLTPEYDNEPYDFVIELHGHFYRLQAKTAYENKEGTVNFETVSTRARASGYERRGYEGKIDYFIVYNPITDEAYLVPIEDAATGKMEIRHEPTKNGQRAGVNWHEEYSLDRQLDQISRRRRNY